jgi:hypothetical protein
MPPPNSESVVGNLSLQQAGADSNDIHRPIKRSRDAYEVVSNVSSRRSSPSVAAPNDVLFHCMVLLLSDLPSSLSTQCGDISTFRELWTSHGFRTSMVTSPQQAVSIFLDSCKQTEHNDKDEGRNYLLSCIGMHPKQTYLEDVYVNIKDAYCLTLFLGRMRAVREQDMDKSCIRGILVPWEEELKVVLEGLKASEVHMSKCKSLADSTFQVLSQLVSKLTEVDHSLRSDQLLREYNRIKYENCTLANACLQRWLYCDGSSSEPKFQLDQVHFQFSPPSCYIPSRERITIRMKDENTETSHVKLIFMPALSKVLNREDTSRHPFDGVVDNMITTTWEDLLRNGYYMDQNRKAELSDQLKLFYMSGLLGGRESNMPILL